MHLYVQPCLTATTAVVSRILARLAFTEQLLSNQLHPAGRWFQSYRFRSTHIIAWTDHVVSVEQLLIAVCDSLHQPVGCLDPVLGEHLVDTRDLVLGHVHHPLSAAQVEESRSSAAGTSRAW